MSDCCYYTAIAEVTKKIIASRQFPAIHEYTSIINNKPEYYMAAKKPLPSRPEGWKFAGSIGVFHVWHAGKMDYRVTDGADGEVLAHRSQLGLAHDYARYAYDCAKVEA